MKFQRARSDEQIQNRIQEIVNAASIIYNTEGYEGVTFTTISEYTKFTRPNLYKYFKTKEEIILLILNQDLEAWINKLSNSFQINKLYSIQEIGEIWTNTLMEYERLIELHGILYTTIEKNVSVEALAEFEKESIANKTKIVKLVNQLFPKAGIDRITNFIYAAFTLAFGLYPMSKLSDLQIEAIELSGAYYAPPDFKKTYSASLYQLMYCLEHSIELEEL